MASQGDAALDTRRKKISGQQKREALEREISMLEKMLKQEENVHEILNRIHNKDDVSAIPFPDFLPPKMKELLAELVMVEGEIARLEGQISQLQLGLKHEKEVIPEDAKSKQLKPAGNPSKLQGFYTACPSPFIIKGVQDKMAFETKALHFISKAIKGDYNLNDFNPNEKIGASRVFSDQKENHFPRGGQTSRQGSKKEWDSEGAFTLARSSTPLPHAKRTKCAAPPGPLIEITVEFNSVRR
ncbi:hypothetical protein OIU84_008428 [Salix udensis]|uniref:Ternary complex factor MIP1 leucine-zipper domain-containing protein n=1 Tax=Salix udensis TaxID=889485 RepID=A0AAD6JP62_9ROSI|nr:hypothetical protein OIU84_008428 [Salix udensis]